MSIRLPSNCSYRRVTRVTHDEDRETSRDVVQVDATYGWRLTHRRTGEVLFVNADDERTDLVLKLMFDRSIDDLMTHTIEQVASDGTLIYGPVDI